MRSCSRESSMGRTEDISEPLAEEGLDGVHDRVPVREARERDALVVVEARAEHVVEVAAGAEGFDLAVPEQVERGEELLRNEVRRPVGVLPAVVLAVGEVEEIQVPVLRGE